MSDSCETIDSISSSCSSGFSCCHGVRVMYVWPLRCQYTAVVPLQLVGELQDSGLQGLTSAISHVGGCNGRMRKAFLWRLQSSKVAPATDSSNNHAIGLSALAKSQLIRRCIRATKQRALSPSVFVSRLHLQCNCMCFCTGSSALNGNPKHLNKAVFNVTPGW